jgi:hypothetical protein
MRCRWRAAVSATPFLRALGRRALTGAALSAAPFLISIARRGLRRAAACTTFRAYTAFGLPIVGLSAFGRTSLLPAFLMTFL